MLARVWHDSWHIAHANLVPTELLPLRQLGYFENAFAEIAPHVRVIGPGGAPFGFYRRVGNLIDKLFVGTRGKGHGSTLLKDAEQEIRQNGYAFGELQCLVGNIPARNFYEAKSWVRSGETTLIIRSSNKPIALVEWIYRKDL